MDDYRWRIEQQERKAEHRRFTIGIAYGCAIGIVLWVLLYFGYKALVRNDYPKPGDYPTHTQGAL